MSNDDNDEDLPRVGANPAKEVTGQLAKAMRKAKQEEFKKAMNEVKAAAEVFINACDKAAALQEEINNVKEIDFMALRKTLNL